MHQYFTVTNDVLPADFRNYTVNIVGAAVAGKISPLHHGAGWAVGSRNHCHIEYTLSQAEYT